MNTTLNQIRKHDPCEQSWRKLLASLNKTEADDEPLSLRHILDTLGVDDAIWALKSLEGAEREVRLFACDCAERVLPIFEAKYPNDFRPRNAIEVARKYANGEATDEELKCAWDAAWDAARRDAESASGSAAWVAAERDASRAAVNAAGYAAGPTTAGSSEREAQKELFIKYFCQ